MKITQLTIHKVLYLVYSFYLKKGIKLCDIDFEAWKYGPVIKEMWEKYKSFGSLEIKLQYDEDFLIEMQDDLKKGIIHLCKLLTKFKIFDIVNIIHENDPWKNIYKPLENKVIKDKDILEFYIKNDTELMVYLEENTKNKN